MTDTPTAEVLEPVDLRALAELTGPERAFVSLYVSSPEALGQVEDRVERTRLFLDEHPVETEHFEESMEKIRQWIEEHASNDFRGLAVFASWALDYVAGYELPQSVPDLLRVGVAPFLRPLAELQDETETFAVIAADNQATRIFVVTAMHVEDEDRVSGGVKNRVKKGGWSQKRYARRRDHELLHYAQDVVERLQGLDQEHDLRRIVLLGSAETLREIEAALPNDLAAKVAGERAADLDDDRSELVDEAIEVYLEAERADELALWERIKEGGLSNGLAATGATDVLTAAAVGQVEELLVDREADLPGTRCRDCENVVHGTPETCQICGSKSVFQVDLVDELVRLMETTSARVEIADPIPGLTKAGHVAALLRY